MSRRPTLLLALTAMSALTACVPGELGGPSRGGGSEVAVLSRNMYVGTDVDAVIGALASPDPSDDFPALLGAIAVLEATDYPTRAKAMAEEVRRTRPHVVGLQEVSDITIDLAALGLPVDIRIDFLPVLLRELEARGLTYEAVATVRNIEATPLPGIRLVDFDVLLVDTRRVQVDRSTIVARTYQANLGVVAPGVTLQRGWVQVTGRVNGISYTFVNTHLESGSQAGLAQLRAAQASEVIAVNADQERVLILGDLNDIPGSPMWQAFAAAGYADSWREMRPGLEGLTCCHAADLSNPVAQMHTRLDYVLVRTPDRRLPLAGLATLVGVLPNERVRGPAGPIWPSDHAGVFVSLRTPPTDGVAP